MICSQLDTNLAPIPWTISKARIKESFVLTDIDEKILENFKNRVVVI